MRKLKNMFISLKNWLLSTNFALLAFISYTSKVILFGASLEDALVFATISALYGYTMFLKSKKPEPVRLNAEVQAQINDIQKKIRDSQMQNNLSKPKFKW